MRPYVRMLRPAEWIKNVFVLAALAFGVRLGEPGAPRAIALSCIAFVAFCLAASAGYIINDIFDRHRDRLHPVKQHRPIASGVISVPTALVVAGCLIVITVLLCRAFLPPPFWVTLAAYVVLTSLYSMAFKNMMLLDVIVIAVLFVLRALGGAYAIGVPVSPWLLVCTFMLCLFLGFGKRRCEIAMIGNSHALRGHRPTLVRYTPDLLTHLLSTTGGIAVITFLLYTLDTSRESPFGQHRHNLIYTLPLVVYGVFRYAMIIELGQGTGPTDLLVRDRPFLIAVLLWGLISVAILYGGIR